MARSPETKEDDAGGAFPNQKRANIDSPPSWRDSSAEILSKNREKMEQEKLQKAARKVLHFNGKELNTKVMLSTSGHPDGDPVIMVLSNNRMERQHSEDDMKNRPSKKRQEAEQSMTSQGDEYTTCTPEANREYLKNWETLAKNMKWLEHEVLKNEYSSYEVSKNHSKDLNKCVDEKDENACTTFNERLQLRKEQANALARRIIGPQHRSQEVIQDLNNCMDQKHKQPCATSREQFQPRVYGLERPVQLIDRSSVPIHLLTGSRVVDAILGRDPRNQGSRAAFQFEGPDQHPSSKSIQRTWCPTIIDSKVPKDKKDFVEARTWDLAEQLETMDSIYQQICRKGQLSSTANVNFLWDLLDDMVETCNLIKRQIGAAGGSSQEIPSYMIR